MKETKKELGVREKERNCKEKILIDRLIISGREREREKKKCLLRCFCKGNEDILSFLQQIIFHEFKSKTKLEECCDRIKRCFLRYSPNLLFWNSVLIYALLAEFRTRWLYSLLQMGLSPQKGVSCLCHWTVFDILSNSGDLGNVKYYIHCYLYRIHSEPG